MFALHGYHGRGQHDVVLSGKSFTTVADWHRRNIVHLFAGFVHREMLQPGSMCM